MIRTVAVVAAALALTVGCGGKKDAADPSNVGAKPPATVKPNAKVERKVSKAMRIDGEVEREMRRPRHV